MFRNLPVARLAACSVTLLASLLPGCGGGSHPVAGNPNTPTTPSQPSNPATPTFSVTGIVPASGATGVPLNATIQITFSSAAKAATVNSTNIQVTAPKAVSGTVTYNAANNSAIFTPAAPLAPNSTYTVTVSGVTSASGTGLANPYKSNFATVTATSGGGGGTGGGGTGGGGTGGGGTGGGGTGGGGTGGGGTGGGGATSATLQYQAPLLANPGEATLNGQVTVDVNGNVTVQLTGAAAGTTYVVQFCPAANAGNGATSTCFNIGQVSSDAKGNGSLTVKFPQTGSWAGDFNVNLGGKVKYGTWLVPGLNGENYLSTLQPETTVNGSGIANPGYTQSALTSGTVTYSNGALTFTLTGGVASTSYSTNESETVYVDSSGTYALNTFTTDAKGDATSSTSLDSIGGDMFQVGPQSPQNSAGFIGGFAVPK